MNVKVKEQKEKKNKQEDVEVVLLKNQLARALADYDNLQKRVERDRFNLQNSVLLKLVFRLLPILDMLENAQKHLKDAGIAITIKEFEDTLKAEGVEEIKVDQTSVFDENLHEAIEVLESGTKDNIISEVLQRGWKFRDGMVIRPTKVKVFKRVEKIKEKQ